MIGSKSIIYLPIRPSRKIIENISKILSQYLDYVKLIGQFFEIKNDRDIRANDIPILEFEWIQTPLREFGYKCIANKHELCKGCKCLCHLEIQVG